MGYRLPEGKTLVFTGNVGKFAGADLQGGDLFVKGSTGDYTGAGMSRGRIFVSKKTGINTGEWKSGGEIHVEGGIGSLGRHISGGYVYQAGQLKKYG